MFRYDSVYIVNAGDDLGSSSYWNFKFKDIDIRLNSVEAFTSDAEVASQTIIDAGISRINDTIQPYLDSLTTQANALAITVSSLQGQVLTDQGNLTAQLANLVATANAIIANLESLGTIDGGTF